MLWLILVNFDTKIGEICGVCKFGVGGGEIDLTLAHTQGVSIAVCVLLAFLFSCVLNIFVIFQANSAQINDFPQIERLNFLPELRVSQALLRYLEVDILLSLTSVYTHLRRLGAIGVYTLL